MTRLQRWFTFGAIVWVFGAALLLMQEFLSTQTQYWEFWIGWVLLAVVLFARHGLAGALRPLVARKARP